ncbi:MAG: hypothetical protein IJX99_02590 [Clostridia bacterium]|nr:hypothetical protein [Clostridia bacterium]
MKKNILFLLLFACLSLMILVGCENEPTNESDVDAEINVNNSGESNDEVSNEVYLTLDGHGLAGGMLSMTLASEEGSTAVNESVSWDFAATENEKIKDVLVKNGILNVKPELEGDTFEGWLGFKQIITTDDEGYNTYAYEKLSGDTLFTTDEVLEMSMPNHNVTFMAKWTNVPISDYVIEGWSDAPIMDTGYFSFNANGGMMVFRDEETERFELDKYNYWLNEGDTLESVMTGAIINSAILVSVEKEGSTFDGWTVYEADSINWNSEESNEEGYMYLPYDSDDEDFKYIVLENGTLYSSSASIDELSKIIYEGKSYYAVANWK